jgi:TrmH family RNA methyltransferase
MKRDLQGTIRDLHRRGGRDRRGRTLAEGIRLVEEAVAAGIVIDGAAVSPALASTPRGRALAQSLAAHGVHVEAVSEREFSDLAGTEHPQGVLAVIALPAWEPEQVRPAPGRPVLVLDGVQDPGNVGTMARTALALGAAGLVALPGTAELANPKVVRGAMGALFRLPAVHLEGGSLAGWLRAAGAELWVAEAGAEPVAKAKASGPVAIAVGNEGAGVRPEVAALARRKVGIPLAPAAESLNAAIAAAILLYEVTRAD